MNAIRWFMLVGIAGLLAVVGCNKGGNEERAAATAAPKHDHPDGGPHGGALVEWGDEEYHLEFTVDHKAQEATVYVLAGDAKTAKPIKTKELTLTLKLAPPVLIKLAASPQSGDPAATSSRFVGKHAALGVEQEFRG